MKRNRSSFSNSRFERVLRLETLEDRQLLTVNPLEAGAVATPELVANQDFSNAIVDLNELAESTSPLTFAPTDLANSYTMSWDAIAGAQSYNVKISRDGGDTWITYAKPTDSNIAVDGVYVGRSYSYRVFGVNERGKLFGDALEGTFAPVKITAFPQTYKSGETIQITVNGADDASASVKWYYATADGDVEILEASGLLEYAPTSADAPIKVVATGTGFSEGSRSEVTINADKVFDVNYDPATRKVTLDWTDVKGAEIYRVLISRDGGGKWLTYAKPTDSCVTIEGIYVGNSYSFRIQAYDNAKIVSGGSLSGATLLGSSAGEFAPVGLSVDVETFRAGDTITATFKGADNASGNIAWYSMTAGGAVEIKEAAGQYSYTPANADCNIKVVLTGTGDSAGSRVEAIVVAEATPVAEFGEYVTLSRSVDLTWSVIEGATSYRVLKYSETSASGWKRAATVDVKDGVVVSDNAVLSEDGTKLTYNVKMFNVGDPNEFRVVAVDATGEVLENIDASFANFGLELAHDVYSVDGDVLTATTTPTTDVVYQWYWTNDAETTWDSVSGQWFAPAVSSTTWSAIEGATDASYTISAEDAALGYVYKVVATNADGAKSVAYAKPEGLNPVVGASAYVTPEHLLEFRFNAVPNATDYQVEYYNTSLAYPVWLNLTQTTFTVGDDGVVTGLHVNGMNYWQYQIRIRAIGDGVASVWNQDALAPASINYTTVKNIAEPGFGDPVGCSVAFGWDPVAGALSYTVEQKVGEDWVALAEEIEECEYKVNDAVPGATYNFRIRSNGRYASSLSYYESVVPDMTFKVESFTPGRPLSVTSTGYSKAPSYEWYSYNDGEWNPLPAGSFPTLVNPPLVEKIACRITHNDGSYAIKSVEIVRPATPTPLLTYVLNCTEAVGYMDAELGGFLQWNEVANATSYTMERFNEETQSWQVVQEGSDSYYSLENRITPGESARFRVKANGEFASSDYYEEEIVCPELTFSKEYFTPGEPISVSVTAHHLDEVLYYTWYQNDGPRWTQIFNENSDTLVSAPETGKLACVAMIQLPNGYGYVTHAVEIDPEWRPHSHTVDINGYNFELVDNEGSIDFWWDSDVDAESYVVERYDAVSEQWIVVEDNFVPDEVAGCMYEYPITSGGTYQLRIKGNCGEHFTEYSEISVVVPTLEFNAQYFTPGQPISVSISGMDHEAIDWYSWYHDSLNLHEQIYGEYGPTLSNPPDSERIYCEIEFFDYGVYFGGGHVSVSIDRAPVATTEALLDQAFAEFFEELL